MPSQQPKNYAIQVLFEDKWETEYYVDLLSNVYKLIALLKIECRVKDMRTKKIIWRNDSE